MREALRATDVAVFLLRMFRRATTTLTTHRTSLPPVNHRLSSRVPGHHAAEDAHAAARVSDDRAHANIGALSATGVHQRRPAPMASSPSTASRCRRPCRSSAGLHVHRQQQRRGRRTAGSTRRTRAAVSCDRQQFCALVSVVVRPAPLHVPGTCRRLGTVTNPGRRNMNIPVHIKKRSYVPVTLTSEDISRIAAKHWRFARREVSLEVESDLLGKPPGADADARSGEHHLCRLRPTRNQPTG
jgi:hypothetical protein